MSAYLILPLVQTVLSLILIAIVLRGRKSSPTHRLFSIYLLALAIWGIVIFGMRVSSNVEYAYSWERVIIVLSPFISTVLYHFSVRYTEARVPTWLFTLLYGLCFLFAPLVSTDFIATGMQVKPYGYAPIFGPAFPMWILFNYGLFIAAIMNFIRTWRTASYSEERNRAAYIVVGISASLLGGVFDILPVLGFPFYPGLIIGNIVFCILTTLAIVRHSLLDIRVVLRKSIAYTLTSTLVAIPFVGFFTLVNYVFTNGNFPIGGYFAIVVILALTWQPLWGTVQQRVDHWFYRERYNHLKSLETFSWHTQSLTDQTNLGHTMVHLISGALRTPIVHLLQPKPPNDDFYITFSTDVNSSEVDIRFGSDSPLIKWLTRSGNLLLYQDLDLIPQLQALSSKERGSLLKIGASIIVPLKAFTEQLSGLLILGRKLSEQTYTMEDKQLLCALGTQMAITLENMRLYEEARQSEMALGAKEREYRELAESFTDVFFAMNDQLRCTYWNKASEELMGISSKDALGKHLCDLFPHSEATRKAEQEYQEVLRTNQPRHFVNEYEIRNKHFVFEVSAYPSRGGLVAFAKDMTERQRAEEKEKELQEELNHSSRLASIGELAAGVAHEINNPLTGIMGFSQRLLRKSGDESIKRDLERIYEEACRAAKVVDNLRTFARRTKPKKEQVNINAILQKALEMRFYEMKTGSITLVTELAPNLPKVMVDFGQIQQVFLNIIMNAEQVMTEAHGRGKLRITTQQNNDHITIAFTDDGPGIPNENLQKIFTPFFTTRATKGGIGLGLSICHGIVTGHDGRIYLRTKPGIGTTFFVELPLTLATEESRVTK